MAITLAMFWGPRRTLLPNVTLGSLAQVDKAAAFNAGFLKFSTAMKNAVSWVFPLFHSNHILTLGLLIQAGMSLDYLNPDKLPKSCYPSIKSTFWNRSQYFSDFHFLFLLEGVSTCIGNSYFYVCLSRNLLHYQRCYSDHLWMCWWVTCKYAERSFFSLT